MNLKLEFTILKNKWLHPFKNFRKYTLDIHINMYAESGESMFRDNITVTTWYYDILGRLWSHTEGYVEDHNDVKLCNNTLYHNKSSWSFQWGRHKRSDTHVFYCWSRTNFEEYKKDIIRRRKKEELKMNRKENIEIGDI